MAQTIPAGDRLATIKRVRLDRETAAVVIAMYVADGEQPPPDVIEAWRAADASFMFLLRSHEPAAS